MNPRPFSVTFISWWVISSNVIVLLGGIPMFLMQENAPKNPLGVAGHIAALAISAVLRILCCAFMLRGANWSRYVYVITTFLMYGYGVFVVQTSAITITGLVLHVFIARLLLNPNADLYFRREKPRLVRQAYRIDASAEV